MAINLQKGQKISLSKQYGGALNKIVMGLGWDAKTTSLGKLQAMSGGEPETIDLDASCVIFDDQNKVVDIVYFGQLKSRDGSIIHTGDNRSGTGDGDDEQIKIDLNKVPENVKSMVFTVNSFSGQAFDQVEHAYCRIVGRTIDALLPRNPHQTEPAGEIT
jgi:tellurium resistance protein TerZ